MADILLYRDAVENLVDYVQGAPQDAGKRIIKRCIREAFREFMDVYRWSYFDKEATMLLPTTKDLEQTNYTHATNELKSSWVISDVTDTQPAIVTLASPGFAATEGEIISVRNINTVADGEYVISSVTNDENGSVFTLDGSMAIGTFVPGNGEVSYRFVFIKNNEGNRVSYGGKGGKPSFPIVKWIDDFTVILSGTSNPGKDVDGELTTIDARSMLLPEDFIRMGWVTDSLSLSWSGSYLTPDQWLGLVQAYDNYGYYPFRWTVMPSDMFKGRWEMRWSGNPGSARYISFIYRRRPIGQFRWSGIEKGSTSGDDTDPSIDVVTNSNAITGVNTQFSSRMVGAYLRVGDVKTDVRDFPESLDSLNPYWEQHLITSVTSPTSLTLDTPVSFTGTKHQFLISDVLDLTVEHFNAFAATAQRLYAYKLHDEDRIAVAEKRYRDALVLAMEVDYKIDIAKAADGMTTIPSAYQNPRNADSGPYISTTG